jgi:hypothetical protein
MSDKTEKKEKDEDVCSCEYHFEGLIFTGFYTPPKCGKCGKTVYSVFLRDL